jgi:hypothetical protein
MQAEKIIYSLLSTNANLLAQVPLQRIFAGLIPLTAELPAIAYNHVSTVEDTAVELSTLILRSRIQVTVATKNYPQVKNIIDLVNQACNHKKGLIAGTEVCSVVRDYAGSDYRDDELSVFYQTIDFKLVYVGN